MINNLDYYMELPYAYKISPDPELGFFIEIPELPGCRGDGRTIEDAVEDITETKRLWLETALDQGYEIPLPQEEREYGGQFLLRMPKSLHRALAEEAEWEGTSINLYLNTLITESRHIRATTRTQRLVDKIHDKLKVTNRIIESWVTTTETPGVAQTVPPDNIKTGHLELADTA